MVTVVDELILELYVVFVSFKLLASSEEGLDMWDRLSLSPELEFILLFRIILPAFCEMDRFACEMDKGMGLVWPRSSSVNVDSSCRGGMRVRER